MQSGYQKQEPVLKQDHLLSFLPLQACALRSLSADDDCRRQHHRRKGSLSALISIKKSSKLTRYEK
uniref:Uncharacterized protein n=1 Tax=Faecalibaculum rodentium TaxID=1702221 RepID=A0A140DXG8_9FIRM|nr:hypothetical protein AALO17_22110 [Faecalibaculum rodentium]